MDNKQEREKVIDAAMDFYQKGRGNYTFYEDMADFHLAETETLRKQLQQAEEIVDRILDHWTFEGTVTRNCAEKYRERYPKRGEGVSR